MSIEKIGDWEVIRRMVQNLAPDLEEVGKKTLVKVGLKAESIAVKHIQNQDLNWTANIRYTRWKQRAGFSQKILVKTSTYLQSITSWPSQSGKTFYAGVKRTVKVDGVLLADIAKALEYGTRNMPARPLWRPTYQETGAWVRESNIFAKEVSNFFAKKYGI
jgi:hypothetical protein